MRTTRRYLAAAAGALAIAVTSLPCHAESADDAALRTAVDNLGKALIAADKAALEAVVSDQLSFGHTSGRVETKAEFVSNILAKKPMYKSITRSDTTFSVVGNNAIARYTAAVDLEVGGKEMSITVGVMTVWVMDGGTWKLLAHQSFKPT
jgi:hypothetical protein